MIPKEKIPLGDLAWRGVLETGGRLRDHFSQFGIRARSRSTGTFTDDATAVYADYVYVDEDGNLKTYRVSVSITEPYGDGRGYCATCRVQYTLDYADEVRRQIVDENMCFTCLYWKAKVERGLRPDSGNSYVLITPEFDYYTFDPQETTGMISKSTLGHSGRWFTARLFNGTDLRSNDVWSAGRIPSEWRDKLPPNGELIT